MPPPRTRTGPATPEVTIRIHFGLSQQQLADWLELAVDFVGAIEKGRRPLPAARTERLLVLARLLPPPLGHGPPALPPLPPLPREPPVVAGAMLAGALATAPPTPFGAPADPAPLRAAARTARLAALTAERVLLATHARAVALAHRRRGLAQLQAAPPPAPDPADPQAAARWPAWLADLAEDLALADPHPARAAAEIARLTVRAAARYAEAAALLARAAAAEAGEG